jgi:DNA polymerase III gamma/tau subunit
MVVRFYPTAPPTTTSKRKINMTQLHLDYRPDKFEDFIGNSGSVKSLQSKLKQKALPHSILLQGPSGCGKTTIGRILKSELNCSDFDFIEINVGNESGIQTGRQIIQNINFKPTQGDVRIYLLDECQQMSKAFQSSLLKPLEDTPKHAYFILCTTDPQKLLLTIRNRCTTYEVEKLKDKQVVELLEKVAKKEKKEVDESAIDDIVMAADGCPRQALVVLGQIIDMDPRRQRRAIKSYLSNEKKTIDLCRALANGSSWPVIRGILTEIEDEPEKVRRAVIGYMRAIALNERSSGAKIQMVNKIYQQFVQNYYDTGPAGLVFSCWCAVDKENIHI